VEGAATQTATIDSSREYFGRIRRLILLGGRDETGEDGVPNGL
jgi:hypothetical protein